MSDKHNLKEDIINTKQEINLINQKLKITTDLQEIHQLNRRKKELQYLQLWHLDQYGWDDLSKL